MMDLAEKDKYIADHLMKLEPDTLRFMVVDLMAEVERLTGLEVLWKAQNDLNAEENKELRDKVFKRIGEVERLTARITELEAERDRRRDDEPGRFLEWRGIDVEYGGAAVCKDCQGSGVKAYGGTSTWRGGMCGQMITSDVCDKCWGSGNTNDKGADLRKFTGELQAAKRGAVTAYQKGQEDMRESAGETIDCKADDLTRAGAFGPASGFRAAASDIRALPIKEAALSAKEGK
jgi:hypothetical protein